MEMVSPPPLVATRCQRRLNDMERTTSWMQGYSVETYIMGAISCLTEEPTGGGGAAMVDDVNNKRKRPQDDGEDSHTTHKKALVYHDRMGAC
jgi:hypothetical protein